MQASRKACLGVLSLLLLVCSQPLWAQDTEPATPARESSCCSKLSFSIDTLFLTRAATVEQEGLVYDDSGTGGVWGDDDELIGTREMEKEFGFDFTPRITASYELFDNHRLEACYYGFGLLKWKSREQTANNGNLEVHLLFDTWEFRNFDFGSVTYESELNHNAELNWRWRLVDDEESLLHGTGILGGFRYMNLEENLELFCVDLDSGLYSIETTNNVFGVQLGGHLRVHPLERFSIDLTGKAAGCFNRCRTRSVLNDDLPAQDILGKYSRRKTDGAFVGEVALSLRYRLVANVYFYAGYQGLLMTNVALAPDQLDFRTPAGVGARRLDNDGQALFHGGFFGLEVTEGGAAANNSRPANESAACDRFKLSVDTVFLTRAETVENEGLVYDDSGTVGLWGDDSELISTRDLEEDFGFDFTPRITASYEILEDHCLEASYFGFGLLQWKSREQTATNGNLEVHFPFITDEFDDADFASVTYESELNHNAEANWRWCLVEDEESLFHGTGVLGGLRYLNLEENLELYAIDNDSGFYTIETTNHLFGPQLGGNLRVHPHERFSVELRGKAGGCFNRAWIRSVLNDDLPAQDILGEFKKRETEGAFVGELALSLRCELLEDIYFFTGYEGLFLSNVALAPDQLDFRTPAGTGARRLDNDGHALYHGGFFGLEANW